MFNGNVLMRQKIHIIFQKFLHEFIPKKCISTFVLHYQLDGIHYILTIYSLQRIPFFRAETRESVRKMGKKINFLMLHLYCLQPEKMEKNIRILDWIVKEKGKSP
jgi:hypothetical protein